jgi:hypothetical protein
LDLLNRRECPLSSKRHIRLYFIRSFENGAYDATLVKKDNHDLPDADDDNKEYDQKSKLEFGNYETEEDTEECNSENLPELQLSHSSSHAACDFICGYI